MVTKNKTKKKYYTVAEANATLPLLRSILRDITELAVSLQERYERLTHLRNGGAGESSDQEEIQEIDKEFEHDQERMKDFENELRTLQVELKDYFSGLVDFPSMMDGREVYLCWRLGEPEVGHWHDLESGFAGRQKLPRIIN
jgi:hypothetical protein